MDPSHLLNPNAVPRRQSSRPNGTEPPRHKVQEQPQQQVSHQGHAEPRRAPRKLVLCFDGTGNKFRGDEADSNILKIFRCLDRTAGDQYHYYQPGIGTYVVSSSLGHTGLTARLRSWYTKAKDSAVGSSFDQHVVGGYRFLMRFYMPGDEIYFFGFSRGAYVARFLAEMLDHVGLLSHGNEEMVRFAWKAFAQWQARADSGGGGGGGEDGGESKEERKKREMYRFMKGFRETFSRPVKRIRFLGLFDTVNSVPRFEAAWMQRSKFPYTAKSSAKVIRHAVSIDERRAKFRQDLMYQNSNAHKAPKRRQKQHHHQIRENGSHAAKDQYRGKRAPAPAGRDQDRGRPGTLAVPGQEQERAFRPHSRSRSPSRAGTSDNASEYSHVNFEYDSEDDEQDIDEVWFAGGHGDVGGGWEFMPDSKSASHVPLAWMIHEAQRAGLNFDPDTLEDMGLAASTKDASGNAAIKINVSMPSPPPPTEGMSPSSQTEANGSTSLPVNGETKAERTAGNDEKEAREEKDPNPFHQMLHKAHLAPIHDSLTLTSGLGTLQVASWNLMEYLPFRRMDLQSDGSWRPIRWPLPRGEVRDIPASARVHGSVVARMRADAAYRPGNLIVGGGGRGVRRAPERHGMGEWECVKGHGDPIGEIWVKKLSAESS